MRKSLLVLLLWAPFATALLPPPGQRLDQPTQQAIQRFLLHNRILDSPQDLDNAPYIVAREGRARAGRQWRACARQGRPGPGPAKLWDLSPRQGSTPTPKRGELLGINADDIGTARFVMAGDLSTLAVQRVTQEVRPGDRLLRAAAAHGLAAGTCAKSAPFIEGNIIDIPKGVTQIGVLDAVTLNKGRRDGSGRGPIADRDQNRRHRPRPLTGAPTKLPDERAGTLLVFRTYEKLSYGLVLSASRPLAVMDRFETAASNAINSLLNKLPTELSTACSGQG